MAKGPTNKLNMSELQDYFKPYTRSVQTLLGEDGIAFLIPPYQRPYAWKKAGSKKDYSSLTMLLGDVIEGYNLYLTEGDNVKFLGTFLTEICKNEGFSDNQKESEKPAKVYTVIDGQQRLTTLLLFILQLDGEIAMVQKEFESVAKAYIQKLKESLDISSDPSEKVELEEKIQKFEADLAAEDDFLYTHAHDIRKCFVAYKGRSGMEKIDNSYLPKMIRSLDDVWDRIHPKYTSPIASYIFHKSAHSRSYENLCSNGNKLEKFDLTKWSKTADEDQRPFYDSMVEAVKQIDRAIGIFKESVVEENEKNLEKEEDSVFRAPSVDYIRTPKDGDTYDVLFARSKFPDFGEGILQVDDNRVKKQFLLVFQLRLLAAYLLHKVGMTHVNTERDNMAFDIFEALNTTGTPLTAFETFKPHVYEKITDLGAKRSFKYMEDITKFLENYSTDDLLLDFAFADSGCELPKRLNRQRLYLNEYDNLDNDDKEKFVESLFHTKEFLKAFWSNKFNIEKCMYDTLQPKDLNALKACFTYFWMLNHTRAHGPLIRFYSSWYAQQETQKPEPGSFFKATQDFVEATKACAAFTTLWRLGCGGSTSGVDDEYAKIMRGTKDGDRVICRPFSRRVYKGTGLNILPPVSELKKYLKDALESKIPGGKEAWVKKVANQNFSKSTFKLVRFFLLAAFQDAVMDQVEKDILIRGKAGTAETITQELLDEMTLEHIAPSTRDNGWKDKKYDDIYNSTEDLLNHLGNYTLLPQLENSTASNRDWEVKKTLYEMIASDNPINNQVENWKSASGVELNASDIEKLSRFQRQLSWLGPLAKTEEPWGSDTIRRRSVRIAELGYDTLIEWLS